MTGQPSGWGARPLWPPTDAGAGCVTGVTCAAGDSRRNSAIRRPHSAAATAATMLQSLANDMYTNDLQ